MILFEVVSSRLDLSFFSALILGVAGIRGVLLFAGLFVGGFAKRLRISFIFL